jgi:hypothetical protein
MATLLANVLSDADFEDIDLVGFDPQGAESFYSFGGSYGVGWTRILEADERAQLRALLDALPAGKQARCHNPAFGIRFGTPPRVKNATVCFACNNIYADGQMVEFEAESPEGRALLAFLRARTPKGWSSGE